MTCPSCGGPMSRYATKTCYGCRYGGPWPHRLWSQTIKDQNGCLVWTGGTFPSGYGMVKYKGRTHRVHRVAWSEANGKPVPEGLILDHLCRNKLCINPDHLEPVTVQANTLRGIGPSAANAVKETCLRGHPLSGYNLMATKGHRRCRECARERGRQAFYRRQSTPEGRAAYNAEMRAYRAHRKAIGRPLP